MPVPTAPPTSADDQLLSLANLGALIGLGHTATKCLVRRPGFPASVRLSQRVVRWWHSEVLAWLDTQRSTYNPPSQPASPVPWRAARSAGAVRGATPDGPQCSSGHLGGQRRLRPAVASLPAHRLLPLLQGDLVRARRRTPADHNLGPRGERRAALVRRQDGPAHQGATPAPSRPPAHAGPCPDRRVPQPGQPAGLGIQEHRDEGGRSRPQRCPQRLLDLPREQWTTEDLRQAVLDATARGLRRSTLASVRNTLGGIVRVGVNLHYLDADQINMSSVRVPRNAGQRPISSRGAAPHRVDLLDDDGFTFRIERRHLPTIERIHALAESLPHPYDTMVLLTAYAGPRWGEVVALEADDVDTAERTIHIRRTAVEAGGMTLQRPRTAATASPSTPHSSLRRSSAFMPKRSVVVAPEGRHACSPAARTASFGAATSTAGTGRKPARARAGTTVGHFTPCATVPPCGCSSTSPSTCTMWLKFSGTLTPRSHSASTPSPARVWHHGWPRRPLDRCCAKRNTYSTAAVSAVFGLGRVFALASLGVEAAEGAGSDAALLDLVVHLGCLQTDDPSHSIRRELVVVDHQVLSSETPLSATVARPAGLRRRVCPITGLIELGVIGRSTVGLTSTTLLPPPPPVRPALAGLPAAASRPVIRPARAQQPRPARLRHTSPPDPTAFPTEQARERVCQSAGSRSSRGDDRALSLRR